MAYRSMTRLRPMFVNNENQPRSSVRTVIEESVPSERPRGAGLSALIQKSYEMKYRGAKSQTHNEVISQEAVQRNQPAPVLSDKAVKEILDGGTDKVAPSGRPLPN